MPITSVKIDVQLNKPLSASKMEAQADDVIGGTMVEMGQLMERLVKEDTPIGATGLTRGSVFSEPRGTPIREVLIGSTQAHFPILDRGRRPGKFPPPGPILLWVRRKLQPKSDKELRGLAFVVARKIAKKGTSGAAMVFKAFTRARPVLERLANRIGGTIVAEWEK